MQRLLGIFTAIALSFASTPVDAQVFKPKSKKAAATKTQKKAKQPRAGAKKKRVAKKKKPRAEQVAENDGDESASNESEMDYVKIWDDDDIE